MQYLTSWRMQLAAGLLVHTDASVVSVALEVGYESEAAFVPAFKKMTGLPPGQWRREWVRHTVTSPPCRSMDDVIARPSHFGDPSLVQLQHGTTTTPG